MRRHVMFKVLVVDDDADLRLSVASALSESHYLVDQATDGEEGVNKAKAGKYDLVLLDVNMPRMSGLEALKEIKAHDPSIIVIILTAFSNVRDAVEATKEGAYNYLEKPIKAENLVYLVDKALKAHNMVKNLTLSAPVFRLQGGADFVGESNEMKRVFSVIDRLSRVDTAVLIRGESGTGKELVAKALHFNSPRARKPFVIVNMGAIPTELVESELFGHEKGAFTDARDRRIGKFEEADGGTIFLDEIGEMDLGLQAKRLRVLQEKEITRMGSNKTIRLDFRLIAATNRNLAQEVKEGRFREDLFYRIQGFLIHLPPLNERGDDILLLAKSFLSDFCQQNRLSNFTISKEACQFMLTYAWPGNIRELKAVIERAALMAENNTITVDDLTLVTA